MGHQMTSSAAKIILPFPTSMRTRPTAVETTGTATDYSVARTSTYEVCNAVPTFAGASKEVANVNTSQVQASLSTGIAVVLRANSRASENRFMAVLLICEGMKMLFQAVDIIPYLPQFEPLWNVIWLVKIDVFIIGTITVSYTHLTLPTKRIV